MREEEWSNNMIILRHLVKMEVGSSGRPTARLFEALDCEHWFHIPPRQSSRLSRVETAFLPLFTLCRSLQLALLSASCLVQCDHQTRTLKNLLLAFPLLSGLLQHRLVLRLPPVAPRLRLLPKLPLAALLPPGLLLALALLAVQCRHSARCCRTSK